MTKQDMVQRLLVVLNSAPKQRLGQLLVNATYDRDKQLTPQSHLSEIFYMKDEDIINTLENYVKATQTQGP